MTPSTRTPTPPPASPPPPPSSPAKMTPPGTPVSIRPPPSATSSGMTSTPTASRMQASPASTASPSELCDGFRRHHHRHHHHRRRRPLLTSPASSPAPTTVDFVNPGGYLLQPPADQGANDAIDSDADTTTGITASATLASGENDTTCGRRPLLSSPPSATSSGMTSTPTASRRQANPASIMSPSEPARIPAAAPSPPPPPTASGFYSLHRPHPRHLLRRVRQPRRLYLQPRRIRAATTPSTRTPIPPPASPPPSPWPPGRMTPP